MLDLEPATRMTADLVDGVADDQLDSPTPCAGTSLAGLLDHVDGLAVAFAMAAAKTGGDVGPSADASRLGDDWRTRIRARLEDLARAWQRDEAWQGMTRVAGLDLPAEVAASIALGEVIVHGWDIAVASGQSGDWPPELVGAALSFVAPTAEQNPDGLPGMFGPPVAVPADRPPLEHLLGLSGRDPGWRAPSARA